MKRKSLLTIGIIMCALLLGACGNEDDGHKRRIKKDSIESNEIESAISSIAMSEYINSIDDTTCRFLYDSKKECSSIPDIEGNWQRTNIHSSLCAELTISSVKNEGFSFNLFAMNGGNMGEVNSNAYFVTENCAVSDLGDDEFYEGQFIVFIIEDECIKVYATGSEGEVGLGGGVFVGGEYILGEPQYTNADILNELYTQEQLDTLKSKLTAEYYEIFETTTEDGEISIEENQNEKVIRGFIRGLGGYDEYDITIRDEKVERIAFGDGTVVEF